MKKIVNTVICSVIGIMLISNIVCASTRYKNYDTTVGKLNGNGYTGYQTKIVSGANGTLRSKSVGGKYKVDARMVDESGDKGKWVRNVDDNSTYELPGNSKQKAKEKVRVQFSNNINTKVDVQVTGSFRTY